MKILIADDSSVQRLVLTRSLQRLGYEVVVAEDGEQAWNYWQKDYFSIIVTDWQMPKLSGVGLCKLVRAHPKDYYTYIIVLTSLDSKSEYLEAIDAGADDFFIKPYEDDMLAARLLVAQRIGGLLSQAKQIEGLLPVCPNCKKIKTEEDKWVKVEQYLTDEMKAQIQHGMCPECKLSRTETERSWLAGLRASG